MKPQFRIREEKDRFYVEYLHRKGTFSKKEIWKPYITYTGGFSIYPFTSLLSAKENLKLEVYSNALNNYKKL